MRSIQLILTSLLLLIFSCNSPQAISTPTTPVLGQLKVGFDIDDTVLFSRDNFLKAPHMSDDPDHLDYGWVNSHDSLYSVIIEPIAELITWFRSKGHEVYFITARPGPNGAFVARHLSRTLGFQIEMNKNLFFSPKRKDPVSGHRFTSKHELISELGLHIFYGDSDTDMVAASVAGVRGVRVVRDARSVDAYSRNYFGDTKAAPLADAPFTEAGYQKFLAGGVGPYGETIYPIYLIVQDSTTTQE